MASRGSLVFVGSMGDSRRDNIICFLSFRNGIFSIRLSADLRGTGLVPSPRKDQSGSPMNSNLARHPKLPGKITAAPRVGYLGSLHLRIAGLPAQEAQQFGVDIFRVCPRDAVWALFHDEQASPFDELGGAQPRSRDWKNAVGISLNHQGGHIDAGEIPAEVLVPGRDTGQAGGGGGSGRYIPAGLDGLFADTLTQQ